jgi:hypothetical protein
MTVREQCLKFSYARTVTWEASDDIANNGFCDPGASILEITTFNDYWM